MMMNFELALALALAMLASACGPTNSGPPPQDAGTPDGCILSRHPVTLDPCCLDPRDTFGCRIL